MVILFKISKKEIVQNQPNNMLSFSGLRHEAQQAANFPAEQKIQPKSLLGMHTEKKWELYKTFFTQNNLIRIKEIPDEPPKM